MANNNSPQFSFVTQFFSYTYFLSDFSFFCDHIYFKKRVLFGFNLKSYDYVFLGLDNLLIQLSVDIQTRIIFGGEFMKIMPKIGVTLPKILLSNLVTKLLSTHIRHH